MKINMKQTNRVTHDNYDNYANLGILTGILGISILALTGCGGSNTGGLLNPNVGASRATILLTDSPREDYDHIWATVYHVELIPQGGGTPVVVFDNAAGVQIDLKTLRDATGAKYSFLSSATLPAGTYTGASVTIGKTMQLFPRGVTTGTTVTVATTTATPPIAVDASGNPLIPITFRSPKTFSATVTNVCLDFNLAKFIIRGSQVIPSVVEGDGVGLTNPSQHEQGESLGTVSNLSGTAPTQTFTLTQTSGTVVTTVTVVTTASTAIRGAALANGGSIEVTGTLDPTTQNLVATEIEVKGAGGNGQDNHGPLVMGAVTVPDATAGTFTIATSKIRGFASVPTQTTVNVVTSATTIFYADNGSILTQATFFPALAALATPTAIVQGTYDATSNTLTATTVKVVDTTKIGGWEHDNHSPRGGGGDHGGGNGGGGH